MKTYRLLIVAALTGFLLFVFVFASNNDRLIPAILLDGLKVSILVGFSLIIVDVISFLLINIFFRRTQGKYPAKILKLVLSFLLYAICAFIILQMLGQDTTVFGTTTALFTAVVGFAMKDPLSNLLSGIFIQLDRPFKIGDLIEFKGLQGVVESIDWNSTDIRLNSGELNYIPNAAIVNDSVKLIAADRVYRTVDFTVAATMPPHQVMDTVTQAVLNQPSPNINVNLPVFVRMWSYGRSDINYKLFYYPNCYNKATDDTDPEIRCRIWYALSRSNPDNSLQPTDNKRLLSLISSFEFFGGLSREAQHLLIQNSHRLLFDAEESLNFQNLLFPAMFLVVKGSIEIAHELTPNSSDRIPIQPFSRRPKSQSSYVLKPQVVEQVATKLAKYLGPVAFSLTYQTAKQVSSVYWLYMNLATEIEDLAQREEFLSHQPEVTTEPFQAGDIFGEMSLFSGELLPNVKMVAAAETELLAVMPSAVVTALDLDRISIDTLSQYMIQYHHNYLHGTLQELSWNNLSAEEISVRIRKHFESYAIEQPSIPENS